MTLLRLAALSLAAAATLIAQDRFEAGGQFGYGGFLEDDNTGGRALIGGHFGIRLNDTRSLLVEYTQLRRSGDFGYRQRHNLFGLTLHTERRPWNAVRIWTDLGAGGGVRTRDYSDIPQLEGRSQAFAGVYGGVGVAFDVGERVFVRPGVRAYFWGPSVAIGLAPIITVGYRFQ
jgi:hypothetical protein